LADEQTHPMPQETSVHQRRRTPTATELQEIPWLDLLKPEERARVVPQLVVSDPQVLAVRSRIGSA